ALTNRPRQLLLSAAAHLAALPRIRLVRLVRVTKLNRCRVQARDARPCSRQQRNPVSPSPHTRTPEHRLIHAGPGQPVNLGLVPNIPSSTTQIPVHLGTHFPIHRFKSRGSRRNFLNASDLYP